MHDLRVRKPCGTWVRSLFCKRFPTVVSSIRRSRIFRNILIKHIGRLLAGFRQSRDVWIRVTIVCFHNNWGFGKDGLVEKVLEGLS